MATMTQWFYPLEHKIVAVEVVDTATVMVVAYMLSIPVPLLFLYHMLTIFYFSLLSLFVPTYILNIQILKNHNIRW